MICGLIKNPIENSICQNVLKNPCPFVFANNKRAQKECEQVIDDIETGKIFDVYNKIENSFKTIIILNIVILCLIVVVMIMLFFHIKKK